MWENEKIVLFVFYLIVAPFANAQIAPGGVGNNLSFWLRADMGITLNGSNVSSWQSQNSGNQVSEASSSRQPLFISNGLNFNPVLRFDGTANHRLFTNSGFASHTQIIVFNPSNEVSTNLPVEVVYAHSLDSVNSNAGLGVGNLQLISGGFPKSHFFSSTDVNVFSGGEYIATLNDDSFSTNDPYLVSLRESVDQSSEEIWKWGKRQNPVVQFPTQYGVFTNRGFAIGQRFGDNFRLSYSGDIAELISYSSRVSDSDFNKINSYLSLKYGITLNQDTPKDYVNSQGATIFDLDGVYSDFIFNIAGIGRDDASGLNQKQSRSTTTNSAHSTNEDPVSIALGSHTTSNLLNTHDFVNNQSFFVWGNNGDDLSFNTSLTIGNSTLIRAERVWATQETNTMSEVEIRIPQSAIAGIGANTNLVLLIASDAAFTTDVIVKPFNDDSNGNWVTTHDFINGSFFSIALQNQPTADDCELIVPIKASNSNIATVCL